MESEDAKMTTENRIEKFNEHWQKQYKKEPYYDAKYTWDDFDPAYRYAYDSQQRHATRHFADVEDQLAAGWDRAKGKSRLAWNDAKAAVRSGWDSIERMMPGDADRDGR
jgi:hypothetical protein